MKDVKMNATEISVKEKEIERLLSRKEKAVSETQKLEQVIEELYKQQSDGFIADKDTSAVDKQILAKNNQLSSLKAIPGKIDAVIELLNEEIADLKDGTRKQLISEAEANLKAVTDQYLEVSGSLLVICEKYLESERLLKELDRKRIYIDPPKGFGVIRSALKNCVFALQAAPQKPVKYDLKGRRANCPECDYPNGIKAGEAWTRCTSCGAAIPPINLIDA
jgi:hypothetical protein